MTAGLVMIFSYFIPHAQSWGETVAIWFDVLASIAFILGGGNLLKIHLQKISSKGSGWGYSGIILVTFLLTLTIGLFKIGVNPSSNYPDYAWAGNYRESGSPFWWIYEYAFKPLTATMFSMLAFYVASAAFRAFRAKNIEAILLLGTAFIILLGRTAIGGYLTGWFPESLGFLKAEELTVKIMQWFNKPRNRAFRNGIALVTGSVALKIILGVDHSYIGSGDE